MMVLKKEQKVLIFFKEYFCRRTQGDKCLILQRTSGGAGCDCNKEEQVVL